MSTGRQGSNVHLSRAADSGAFQINLQAKAMVMTDEGVAKVPAQYASESMKGWTVRRRRSTALP